MFDDIMILCIWNFSEEESLPLFAFIAVNGWIKMGSLVKLPFSNDISRLGLSGAGVINFIKCETLHLVIFA